MRKRETSTSQSEKSGQTERDRERALFAGNRRDGGSSIRLNSRVRGLIRQKGAVTPGVLYKLLNIPDFPPASARRSGYKLARAQRNKPRPRQRAELEIQSELIIGGVLLLSALSSPRHHQRTQIPEFPDKKLHSFQINTTRKVLVRAHTLILTLLYSVSNVIINELKDVN